VVAGSSVPKVKKRTGDENWGNSKIGYIRESGILSNPFPANPVLLKIVFFRFNQSGVIYIRMDFLCLMSHMSHVKN
jgi:hypothetical protein